MSNVSKDKNNELIALRWAKALADVVEEDANITATGVLTDLETVVETINSSETLANMINNPSISVNEKQIVICKLFQNTLNSFTYNFIFTLNLKQRINLIELIAKKYKQELEMRNNVERVAITSAIELTEQQREKIVKVLTTKLNKKIIIDFKIDSSIIGGLVFNINETIIDNSIKYKLESLNNQIK